MADNEKKTEASKRSLDAFRALVEASPRFPQPYTRRTSIEDEIAREKKLKNDDTEQDIELKKKTLNRLFLFLASETIAIFAFAFLQATNYMNFLLEEWSFKLLTTVTISQITIMLFVAVSYLFPKHKER